MKHRDFGPENISLVAINLVRTFMILVFLEIITLIVRWSQGGLHYHALQPFRGTSAGFILLASIVWLFIMELYQVFTRFPEIRRVGGALRELTGNRYVPRFSSFLKEHKNLRALHDRFVSDIQAVVQAQAQAERSEKKLTKLEMELAILDQEFTSTIAAIGDSLPKQSIEKHIESYRSAGTMAGKRSVVRMIQQMAQAKDSLGREREQKINQLKQLFEEARRGQELCAAAANLVASAELATSHKERVGYLKRAIDAQKAYVATLNLPPEEVPIPVPIRKIRT